jgi:hypothetical protein
MNVIKPHGQRFAASLDHNFDTTKQDRFKTQNYGSRCGLTGQQRGQRFIERKPAVSFFIPIPSTAQSRADCKPLFQTPTGPAIANQPKLDAIKAEFG